MSNAQYDSAALDWLNGPMVTLANSILPFYRRHPYHGQLWLAEIDMRIAVCPSHRFVYNRLPKNANSTVTASLVRAVRGRDRQHGDVKDKWFFQRPSPAGRQVSANSADYTKIVFVRDPVSRTLSAYRDKIALACQAASPLAGKTQYQRSEFRGFLPLPRRHGAI